jgi:hypothetical protein
MSCSSNEFSKQSGSKNVQIFFKKYAFLRCLDNLQFKCIFHKQPGPQSGSKIRLKPDPNPDNKKNKNNNNFGSTTLSERLWQENIAFLVQTSSMCL